MERDCVRIPTVVLKDPDIDPTTFTVYAVLLDQLEESKTKRFSAKKMIKSYPHDEISFYRGLNILVKIGLVESLNAKYFQLIPPRHVYGDSLVEMEMDELPPRDEVKKIREGVK